MIAANLDDLFPGMEIVHHSLFRVTRDTDYDVSDEADDLLQAVEEEVRRRRFGEVVRLEVSAEMEPRLREQLVEAMKIDEQQVYDVGGLLGLDDLWDIDAVPGFTRAALPALAGGDPAAAAAGQDAQREVDVFAAMREGDILVHHPYDSFTGTVERFVRQAVEDPNVLAIKQTVYRTSADSPLVPGLIEASERGKQAVCLVELKARFDESANIRWAKALEEAGVHVVYGIPGLKTHVKCVLVPPRGRRRPQLRPHRDGQLQPEDGPDLHRLRPVHRESGDRRGHRRDVQLPDGLRAAERTTARSWWRRSTCKEGSSARSSARSRRTRRSEPARIRMKMNSLLDAPCIQALYRASQAGVEVDLNVRGICALRPGVPGVSENIQRGLRRRPLPRALADLLLRARRERRIFIGSADLMPRNLYNRVELLAPVEDPSNCGPARRRARTRVRRQHERLGARPRRRLERRWPGTATRRATCRWS